jgi:hypothetical protein
MRVSVHQRAAVEHARIVDVTAPVFRYRPQPRHVRGRDRAKLSEHGDDVRDVG